MNFIKNFFILLSIGTTIAIYGAYYISNIADLKINSKASSGQLLEEKLLFDKFSKDYADLMGTGSGKIGETGDVDKNNKEIEIFKKEAPAIKIITSNLQKDKIISPENKILISFGEEIDIYSLLGFKKIENGKYKCDGKIIQLEKNDKRKIVRCNHENKLFLIKKGGDEKIFRGVIKKSKIDKKTIIIITKLDELQRYTIKIKKGVKSFKPRIDSKGIYSELKEDYTIDFETTDKNGKTLSEIENENKKTENSTGSNLDDKSGTGSTSTGSTTNQTDDEDDNSEEWVKQKKLKIGEQVASTGAILNNETSTGATETGSTSSGSTSTGETK